MASIQTIIGKHGYNWRGMTVDQLEAAARDIQREVNRRYESATPEMKRMTSAYKNLQRSGGKISLSKGYTSSGTYIGSQNQTTQQYRGYLMSEIVRGMSYLQAQTSSYTGYQSWKRSTKSGMLKAFDSIHGDPLATQEFKKWMEKSENFELLIKVFSDFKRNNPALYLSVGSDFIVNSIYKIVMVQSKNLTSQDKRMGETTSAYTRLLSVLEDAVGDSL